MPYSNTIQVKYTLEPSNYIRELYRKTYDYDGDKETYNKSLVYCVISLNGEEKGVVAISNVSGTLWNAHIAADYPLLGNRLKRACDLIMNHTKEQKIATDVITCPVNKLAHRFAIKCGFKVINLNPLLMIRRL